MYLLRWKFEYKNSSVCFGMWSQQGARKQNQAWYNNKNIQHAFIEVKDTRTNLINTICSSRVDEFLNFQWIGLSKFNNNQTIIIGLKMLTTKKTYDVFDNGKMKITDTPISILKTNFRTFGR